MAKKNETTTKKIDKTKEIIKENIFTKILGGLKKFFNNPIPLIIVLIALNGFLLLYISNYNEKNKIYVGSIEKTDVAVVNVHYFTNGDMNYFYASNALYNGEKKDIYSYEMGYYVKNMKGEFVPFATRSRKLDQALDLGTTITEMSGWNFAEADSAPKFFTSEVLNNMEELYFIVKASTEENSTKADIYIEYPVETIKVTK